MANPNDESHLFSTTIQTNNDGQQGNRPPLQFARGSADSKALDGYFQLQNHSRRDSFNMSYNIQHMHAIDLTHQNIAIQHRNSLTDKTRDNIQHFPHQHPSGKGDSGSQMSPQHERITMSRDAGHFASDFVTHRTSDSNETQVVYLTMATNNMALSTPSESSVTSPPSYPRDSQSPNTEPNSKLLVLTTIPYFDHNLGTKGKRRVGGSDGDDRHLAMEGQLTEDSSAKTFQKKVASKKSKEKLGMIYTASVAAPVANHPVNNSYAGSSTRSSSMSLSLPDSHSMSSSPRNFHVHSLGFQPYATDTSQHMPLCSNMIGLEHDRSAQGQSHFNQHQHPYFLQTPRGYLNQTSQLSGLQHQYSRSTDTQHIDNSVPGVAYTTTHHARGARVMADSSSLHHTFGDPHIAVQGEPYQQSFRHHMTSHDQALHHHSSQLSPQRQEHNYQMFQQSQSLQLPPVTLGQPQGYQGWSRRSEAEGIDNLGTLSDDEASITHLYPQSHAKTTSGTNRKHYRKRSNTIPDQEILHPHHSTQYSIEQPLRDLSAISSTSAASALERISNQLPQDLVSDKGFSWITEGGSENFFTLSHAPFNANSTANAPQRTDPTSNSIKTILSRSLSSSKHACHLCRKRFTRPFNLRSHLLAHENKKPFECMSVVGPEGCARQFTRRHDLVRHIKAKHPNANLTE